LDKATVTACPIRIDAVRLPLGYRAREKPTVNTSRRGHIVARFAISESRRANWSKQFQEGFPMKRMIGLLTTSLLLAVVMLKAQGPEPTFNGLDMSLGNLSRLSHAQTRSITAENPTGEKGKGGMATEGTNARAARDLGQGWKVSPSIDIQPKQTFTLAEIQGSGDVQHIRMAPRGTWRFSILRMYWDGESAPSVEVPVGDFLPTVGEPMRPLIPYPCA